MKDETATFLALVIGGCSWWVTHTISVNADRVSVKIEEMDADIATTNADLVNIDDVLERIHRDR